LALLFLQIFLFFFRKKKKRATKQQKELLFSSLLKGSSSSLTEHRNDDDENGNGRRNQQQILKFLARERAALDVRGIFDDVLRSEDDWGMFISIFCSELFQNLSLLFPPVIVFDV